MASSQDFEIGGHCDNRFEPVREAFRDNFADRGEVGGAVAVVLDGKPVVDLWGGWRDEARIKPWEKDTLVCVNSVTKEIMALAFHMVVDRGLVDLDAPVARYWPEFAQAGKENAKVRWLLDHRIGLPVVTNARHGMAYDLDEMATGLAATAPMWPPGAQGCYHSATYGYLLGEVIRRVTGKTPGTFVRDEIAKPLGIDCYIGLKGDEEKRVADMLNLYSHPSMQDRDEPGNIFGMSWRIFSKDADLNSEATRYSEIPSINAHSNARSIARLTGAMACGGEIDDVRLLSAETLRRSSEIQWEGVDAQGRYLSMALGFLMPTDRLNATSPNSLGFLGAGGGRAFADLTNRVGFAYTMNSMDTDLGYPRPKALIAALQSCL